MSDHSDLIERLRHADQHSQQRVWGSRIFEEAASALSSQSLSLSEARALAEAQQNGNRFANSQWTKCELRLKEAEEDRARLLKQRQEREHLYGCTVDLAPDEEPDGCVLDYGGQDDCTYAKNRRTKWTCPCWELKSAFKASRRTLDEATHDR